MSTLSIFGGEVIASGVTSDYYRTSDVMIVTDAGTSRTLSSADDGKILRFTSSSSVTLSVPETLGEGFSVTVIQSGSGKVTFSATGSPALPINNRQSHTATAGQYAIVSLIQDSASSFVLAGDTGT